MSFFYVSQWDVLNQSLVEVQGQINVLFEFFLLCISEMEQILWNFIDCFSSLKLKFVLVIYGANSGERDCMYSIIKGIKDCIGLEVVLYFICIDVMFDELCIIVCDYWNNGICYIVVLCGDLLLGSGKLEMYVFDLVMLLKEVVDFDIFVVVYLEVYLEVKSVQVDLFNLKCKVDVGVNCVIIQFFFDVESYLCFCDCCVLVGIDVEIILGILLVFNFKQVKKFVDMINVCILVWMV